MINKQNPESKPQKESNDDKGDQKTYQNPDPQKVCLRDCPALVIRWNPSSAQASSPNMMKKMMITH